MLPRQHKKTRLNDLCRVRLDQTINIKHELALSVARSIGIGSITRSHRSTLMIGLLLLKEIYGLSDDGVCECWVHDR